MKPTYRPHHPLGQPEGTTDTTADAHAIGLTDPTTIALDLSSDRKIAIGPSGAVSRAAGSSSSSQPAPQTSSSSTGAGSVASSGAAAGLLINVSYDSSLTSLETSNPTLYTAFTGAIQTAVQFYESVITNPITVAVNFGWGEVDNTPFSSGGRSTFLAQDVPYSQLYNAFQANDTASPVQQAAAASLPTSDPSSAGTWVVSPLEEQALGLLPADAASQGWVGLGNTTPWSWSQASVAAGTYDAVGVLEHEISEVLGRSAQAGLGNTPIYEPLDLFRYTAADGLGTDALGAPAGVRDEPFVAGYNPNGYSYFSYNGTTVTLPFDTPGQVAAGNDIADWNLVPDDAFNGSSYPGAVNGVSASDLQVLNALGYRLSSALPPTPAPTPAPTSPPQPTPAPTSSLAVLDTTTGQAMSATAQAYTGPVGGLTSEYVNITADSLNISAGTPNWFLHSGSGNDAIAVSSGINVLDGGTGSNFLTGGTGSDTFFVDDRAATAEIWSTVNNFHFGDAATIWGITRGNFDLSWVDGQGANGYTGLTLHATAAGVPTASLTLAGFTSADLTNGRLAISFGTSGGNPYLYVRENG